MLLFLLLASFQTALPALPALPGPRVERDVPYREVEARTLTLDAYLPADEERHPALLLVHGGAWIHGDKGDMHAFGELLAAEGLACFSLEYRLAPGNRWPAQLEDCVYAVQWLRANAERFHLDARRVGALGLSAGGHLVALLGVLDERRATSASDPVQRESSRVQCVVDYFGPVLLARRPEQGFETPPPPELFRDAPDSDLAAASPLLFVTSDDAPFLLVHGDADTTVPVRHSILMDERLRAAGVSSELIVIPGAGHGDFFFKDPQGAYWKRTEAFLAQRLAPETAEHAR